MAKKGVFFGKLQNITICKFCYSKFAMIEKITSEMVLYQQNFRSTDKQNDAKNCASLS